MRYSAGREFLTKYLRIFCACGKVEMLDMDGIAGCLADARH
jgi:hypothetical protein